MAKDDKDKTMLVKNLVSWAGHGHSYVPGDHITLPVEVAKARITAGLAAMPDPGATEGDNIVKLKQHIAELTKERDELKIKLEAAEKAKKVLTAELAVLTDPGK